LHRAKASIITMHELHAFVHESTEGLQFVTSAMSRWQYAASTHKTDTNQKGKV
jgi:hypothetical protein